ncbi:MAG: hypothetical protein ACE5LQ_06975, partial [Candidatus Bipolaricaulia bacterium]
QGLSRIWKELGLEERYLPRKAEPAYAQVVLHLLRQAQSLRTQAPLRRLLYIGDTKRNDGLTIANLGEHLPIRGFIAAEDLKEPERIGITEGVIYANRWGALADFIESLEGEGFPLDEGTAAIIDLDKTAFGARGRNSHVIDAARVGAIQRTVAESLGSTFEEERFRSVYDELNRPKYHHFTADNQDYLAYICLMVVGGVYALPELLEDLEAGRLSSFAEFIEACNQRPIDEGLVPIHQEVHTNFSRGDPTPFKGFRYREYEETVARMDALPDDTEMERLLAEEIVLTREVLDLCRFLGERGVLLLGLTDKPDEASIPRPELAGEGFLPLHRVTMKVVGEPLDL